MTAEQKPKELEAEAEVELPDRKPKKYMCVVCGYKTDDFFNTLQGAICSDCH